MLIQPAISQPGLMRGTVVLLESSVTVRIIERHKRMEVIPQQLYVPNCIEVGRYTHQRPQTVPRKTHQTMIESLCPCTVPTWHAEPMGS
ncbi:hypothetical protein TNCV_3011161 [Trichonephila clavipes]|nr:hypothetical protein TNCV_3011161 [Trichonephila clavipes]